MKKCILYILLFITFNYKSKAQGENNFQLGSQIHFFSDWKNIQQTPLWQPYLTYTYSFKNNFFLSSEVGWAKYQRGYDTTSSHFNNKRSITNFDNNIGFHFALPAFKKNILSFNLSLGLSLRIGNEEFITYIPYYSHIGIYNKEYSSITEHHTEVGYNIKASVNQQLGKYFNIGLMVVFRNYKSGPHDIALGAEVGYLIKDLPPESEKDLFNDSYNTITIGLQTHYFSDWHLSERNTIKSNIPLIGKKQLNLTYSNCSKDNFIYSLDISSSSYYDSSYSISGQVRNQYIFNIDNSFGYRFHIKKAPTLSLSVSGGVSIRRREDEYISYDQYSPFPTTGPYYPNYRRDTINSGSTLDIGFNLRAELNKRINKHILIGTTFVYRAYIFSYSDFAFGCHIGYQFGYSKKESEN